MHHILYVQQNLDEVEDDCVVGVIAFVWRPIDVNFDVCVGSHLHCTVRGGDTYPPEDPATHHPTPQTVRNHFGSPQPNKYRVFIFHTYYYIRIHNMRKCSLLSTPAP